MKTLIPVVLFSFGSSACTEQNIPTTASGSSVTIETLQSPAGPGSTAPHLQISSDGTLVLSWLKSEADASELQYAIFDGAWSPATTVASGNNWFVNWADFPSVTKINDQLWAAHWLQRRHGGTYAYDVRLSLSSDGKNWRPSFSPHLDETATEHGFVSLHESDGDLTAIWLDGRNTASETPGPMTIRWARISDNSDIGPEGVIDAMTCDCCQTDLAAVHDGLVAVYRDRTDDEIRDIKAVRLASSEASLPISVSDDGWKVSGCPVNGPAIAADGDRLAVAWFTAADQARVKVAFSDDAGLSFSEPVTVSADAPLGRVDIEWMRPGVAIVSWMDEIGDQALIRLQTVALDLSLGAVTDVTRISASRLSGFPQLVRTDDDLLMVWTEAGELSQLAMVRISNLGH